MRRALFAVGLSSFLVLTAAACSDGDEDTLPPVSNATLQSQASVTSRAEIPTTMTVASSTSATSTSTLSAASSTEVPTSSSTSEPTATSLEDVTPPERDELLVAMERWYSTLQMCLRAPTTCNTTVVERAGTGPLASQLLQAVEGQVSDGFQAVPGTQESYYVVLDVVVDEGGESGAVAACVVDGDFSARVNDPSDPADDELFEEPVTSGRITYFFERRAEGWRAIEGDVSDTAEGENRCPQQR